MLERVGDGIHVDLIRGNSHDDHVDAKHKAPRPARAESRPASKPRRRRR
jgi:hypothetical protein